MGCTERQAAALGLPHVRVLGRRVRALERIRGVEAAMLAARCLGLLRLDQTLGLYLVDHRLLALLHRVLVRVDPLLQITLLRKVVGTAEYMCVCS